MGLFDHLFKPKPESGEEKSVEPEAAGREAEGSVESAPRTAASSRPDPSAFLHPKNFIPRAGTPILPAARPGPPSGARPVERKLGPSLVPAAADEIVLTLGDILSRIPPHYLKPGQHDPKRELRFKINDLSSDIARGRAAVPLSRVASLIPDIFIEGITPDADTEVRLPLQKLVEQIGLLRSRNQAPEKSRSQALQAPVQPAAPQPAARKPGTTITPPAIKLGEEPARETLRELRADAAQPADVKHANEPAREHPFAEQPALPKPGAESLSVELKPAQAPPPGLSIAERPKAAEAPFAKAPEPLLKPAEPVAAVAPALPVLETPVPPAVPAPLIGEKKPEPAAVAPVPRHETLRELRADAEKPGEVQRVSDPAREHPVAEQPVGAKSGAEKPSAEIKPEQPKPTVIGAPKEAAAPSPKAPESLVKPTEQVAGIAPTPAPLEASVPPPVPALPIEAQKIPEPAAVQPVAARDPAKFPAVFEPAKETAATAQPGPEVEEPIPRDEEKIQLNLAAILRHCPREIIVGQLPQVDDSVRIALPFAPIDRQLVTGNVEVSAIRFVAALPPRLQRFFTTAPGVKVPIPLEEVFQNLPTPGTVLPAVPEPPSGPILAPAERAIVSPPVADAPVLLPELAAAPTAGPQPAQPVSERAPDSAVSTPEAVPGELAAEVAAPVSEVHEAPGAKSEEKPALHLPAFHLFAPPPPLVIQPTETPQASEVPVNLEGPSESIAPAASESALPMVTQLTQPTQASEVPVSLERPSEPMTPAASEPAPPLAIQPSQPSQPSEIPVSLEGPSEPIAPPAVPRPDAVLTEASAPDAPTESLTAPPHAAPTLTETRETEMSKVETVPEKQDAAAASEAAPPEPSVTEISPSQPEVVPSKLEGIVAPVAEPSPVFAEATKIISLPQQVRMHIPPPPIIGFKPDSEAVVESVEAEHKAEAKVGDSELLPLEVNEDTKVISSELVDAPPATEAAPAVSEPAASPEPELFEMPKADVEAKEALAPQPPTEAPARVHERRFEIPAAVAFPSRAVPFETAGIVQASAPTTGPTTARAVSPAEVAPLVFTPTDDKQPAEEPAAKSTPATPEAAPVSAPTPPPMPLFRLPKIESNVEEPEVIPPPGLPLRRFNQDAMQALFMTDESLDLPKISRLAAALPGVQACVIATRDHAVTGGELPDGFDLAALLGLAPRVGEAAGRLPIGSLKHFTLYGERYSVSFFERQGLCICAVHRARSFIPGVREKLVAIADELAPM